MKQSLWVQSVWSWILSDLRFPRIFQVKPTFPDFLGWKYLRENWECTCYRHSEWRTGGYKQCASYSWLCWLCNDRGKQRQWKWEKVHFYECVKINYLLPLSSHSWLCWLSMIEDKINNFYYQYYALFEMKQTSLFESPNFKPRGRDGIVCLALIFSFYSHVVIQRLLYSNYSLVHQGSLAPLLPFPPLHILCFPKALLIWILGVIKKSSWKHPIHLKFRFIWIFSQETLVECMTRDPKECKAFKLYIQALRSLVDRWHTATR